MPLISVVKFVNWITGTPLSLEDGLVAALAAPVPPNLGTALAGVSMSFNCRLVVNGSNLLLSPYNGNAIWVNGIPQSIPAAGVTLLPTGLVVGTFYYIYAFMSGNTLTLEASTTAYVAHTLGYMQKIGDATRTLVGASVPRAGPIFVDSSGSRYTLSWFNRKRKLSTTLFTANRAVTSVTFVEINAEIRNNFINWAEEDIYVSFYATANATAAGSSNAAATLDVAATIIANAINSFNAANTVSTAGETSLIAGSLAEAAIHFISLANVSTTTMTFLFTTTQLNLQING